MTHLPEPDWYLDNVLVDAEPGGSRSDPGPVEEWRRWWSGLALDDSAVALASGQGYVLRTEQLSALGVSRSRMRTEVRRHRWSSPAVGVVSPIDVSDADDQLEQRRRHALRATACALRRPGHAISGRSAAVLHGLPVLQVPKRGELTAPNRDGLGSAGSAHAFGAEIDAADIATWFGASVTTPARTIVDLSRHDPREGAMAVDAALRASLVTKEQLQAAVERARGWPHVKVARRVIDFGDSAAESPLESLVRWTLAENDFPPPARPNRIIGGYRVDLVWPELMLIIEVDGLGKYRTSGWGNEKRREQHLRRRGWRIERVTWDDIMRSLSATLAHLGEVFGLAV